jgi:hypothetical protein
MEKQFRDFISEVACRLADEPDYDIHLRPKLVELMCMTSWVKSEAWECGLGHTFKENKDDR